MADNEDMLNAITGTVGERSKGVDGGAATGVRFNEHGQVDVAMEIDGVKTQLTQGLDSIYDLLDRGLAETRGRLVALQDEIRALREALPAKLGVGGEPGTSLSAAYRTGFVAGRAQEAEDQARKREELAEKSRGIHVPAYLVTALNDLNVSCTDKIWGLVGRWGRECAIRGSTMPASQQKEVNGSLDNP